MMLMSVLALGSRQAPAHDGCLNRAAGFAVAPFAVDPVAAERQLIGAALILAQHLDKLIWWRLAVAVEFSQTSITSCHLRFSLTKWSVCTTSAALGARINFNAE